MKARKQTEKTYVIGEKYQSSKLLNFLGNLFIVFISICIFLFLCVVSMIFDFSVVKWYGKILMIFGSFYVLYIILLTLYLFSKTIKIKELFFYFSPILITFFGGILSYFDYELWGSKKTIIGIIFAWVIFIAIYVSIKVLLNKFLFKEKTPIVLISLALLIFVIAAINYKENADTASILLFKIGVGIIYLISAALYINKYIYKQYSTNKIISNILGIVFWGALIAISFPFYIKWCGLSCDDFETFISIYAAVLGGGITLAGVAWTIKDTNDDKKRDLILQNKPIIFALFDKKTYNNESPLSLVFLDMNNQNVVNKFERYFNDVDIHIKSVGEKTQNNLKKSVDFVFLKTIVNTDNSIVIVNKIKVGNTELVPLNNNIMEKGKAYNILLSLKKISINSKIKLYVEDVLKNQYCFTIYIKEILGDEIIKKYGIMKIEEDKSINTGISNSKDL